MNGWIYLGVAILSEVVVTSFMKYASISGRNAFLIVFALCMTLSFYFFFKRLKALI